MYVKNIMRRERGNRHDLFMKNKPVIRVVLLGLTYMRKKRDLSFVRIQLHL